MLYCKFDYQNCIMVLKGLSTNSGSFVKFFIDSEILIAS